MRYEALLRVTADDGTVKETEWWSGQTEKGYECSHAYYTAEDFANECEDQNTQAPACQWCLSQKRPALLTPCEVITCPACDELVAAGQSFADHLAECGS